jgi:hypothetical protein
MPADAARVLAVFRRVVHTEDAASAVEAIRKAGQRVVTFTGFSGGDYESPEAVRRAICEQLARFPPQSTTVCAGGTAEGIGMVYLLARSRGFRTIGIISSIAQAAGATLSAEVEVVYVVKDDAWGGRVGARLSPTSEAMVAACDEMVGIGGGPIARDELQEAQARGKPVTFVPAEMNHALASAKARAAGRPQPVEFSGEAQALFPDGPAAPGSKP